MGPNETCSTRIATDLRGMSLSTTSSVIMEETIVLIVSLMSIPFFSAVIKKLRLCSGSGPCQGQNNIHQRINSTLPRSIVS
eukprot:8993377-Ditylum_brightwellii.AAC.1